MASKRQATTKFTPSHAIGKREILRDRRGEFLPTNSGSVRPDGRGRLIAEVSRLGTAEVERLMFAFHRKFKGDKIGVKGHGCAIDLRRDGNLDVAMEFRFPAKMLPETLRVLNSQPRVTTSKQREARRRNAAKATSARVERQAARGREIDARLGSSL